MRIVHYCNQLSLGGTERTMEIFCRLLRSQGHEVFAVSKKPQIKLIERLRVYGGVALGLKKARGKLRLWKAMNARKPNFERILGSDHVLVAKNDKHLEALLWELEPEVLHVHYSGRPEAPITFETLMSRIPVVVTTNPFEIENTSPGHKHVKKMFFVSRWLLENKALWAKKDPRADVLYNPIEPPSAQDDLRSELGIPVSAFVVGRVGRPDPGIHDSISLKAFAQMMDENCYFLALAPPSNMVAEARALKIKNFIEVKSTTDPVRLSRFYNSIDVLAHARKDGETFGCNIAEAMIHGKPVVSHLCDQMNAQTETVGDGGIVTERDDAKAYRDALSRFYKDPSYRNAIGEAARTRALAEFEATRVTEKLMREYDALLAKVVR